MLRAPALMLVAGLASSSAAHAATSAFDGDWRVTLSCPESPSGRALAFSYQFPARVEGGLLHGERGLENQPGWLRLDGPIAPDGSAALVAEGLTNLPSYALNNVHTGTPYRRAVVARFDPSHGSGSWVTLRTCAFEFQKR